MVVDELADRPVGLAQPIAPPLARRQRQRGPLPRVDVDGRVRRRRHQLILDRQHLEEIRQVARLASHFPFRSRKHWVVGPAEIGRGEGQGDRGGEDVVVAAAEGVAEGDEGAGADLQGLCECFCWFVCF